MENKAIIYLFMIELFYLCIFSITKQKTKYFIKYVGMNFKFYPRYYVLPNRFFRKLFSLKKEKILMHFCLSLWIAFVFGVMAFVAPILFLCTPMAAIMSVVVSGIVYFLDFILMLIISQFFKKK